MATKVIFLTAASGSWTVPWDWNVTNNSIKCLAGGGAGSEKGQGGCGGNYSRKNNLSLLPGTTVPYAVGAGGLHVQDNPGGDGGDTWFGGTGRTDAHCSAHGGRGGDDNTTSSITNYDAGDSVGDVKFVGGNGGAANSASDPETGQAGGGGAAGPNGNGGNGGNGSGGSGADAGGGGGGADGGTAGAAGSDTIGGTGGTSGTGGAGGPQGNPGTDGGGGGGGGAAPADQDGGNGGAGDDLWTSTHAANAVTPSVGSAGTGGGGGGGGGSASNSTGDTGGNGGLYGGGGGSAMRNGGDGAGGIIVITYESSLARHFAHLKKMMEQEPMTTLKQSTAVTVKIGPFLDSADANTTETALTIQKADVRLAKNGGDMAPAAADQGAIDAGAAHDEQGYYDIALGTGDTDTLGRLRVMIHKTGALAVWQDFMVVPANAYDALVLGTDVLQADVTQFGGENGTFAAGRAAVNVTEIEGSDASDAIAAAAKAGAVDALTTDLYAEPGQAAPNATASIVTKLGYLYKAWRNRSTQTATQYALYNDDGTTLGQKATVSDDATTTVRGEMTTGP